MNVNTKRIGYIDAIRGFTMLLVVFAHVELFTFGIEFQQSAIGSMFITFRMPMFFFISGYIAFKTRKWDLGEYKDLLKKKTLVQILPTLVFFYFYYYIFLNNTNISFWKNGPAGFWFTIVLFEMFFIYYTTMFLCRKFSSKTADSVLIILAGIGAGVYLGGMKFYDLEYYPVLCLTNLSRYFEFFVLGILCRKNSSLFDKVISSDTTITLISVLFIVCFVFHWNKYMLYELSLLHIINFEFIIRYIGLIMVFAIFHHHKDFFEYDTKWIRCLKFIGRRTLDVYLIHYFLLPNYRNLSFSFIEGGVIFEFVFAMGIAILIVLTCLFISQILRTSKYIGHYLFGAKI